MSAALVYIQASRCHPEKWSFNELQYSNILSEFSKLPGPLFVGPNWLECCTRHCLQMGQPLRYITFLHQSGPCPVELQPTERALPATESQWCHDHIPRDDHQPSVTWSQISWITDPYPRSIAAPACTRCSRSIHCAFATHVQALHGWAVSCLL